MSKLLLVFFCLVCLRSQAGRQAFDQETTAAQYNLTDTLIEDPGKEDEVIDEENRRYAPLAMMLRARTLVDVDCWTEAKGQPIKPGQVVTALRAKLAE